MKITLFISYLTIIVLITHDTAWALAPKLALSGKRFPAEFAARYLETLRNGNTSSDTIRFAERLVRLSSSGSESVRVTEEARWSELSSKLDTLEEAHRSGLSDICGQPQGLNPGQENWYLAENAVFKYIRGCISTPDGRRISKIEKLVDNIPYTTARRAYILYALLEADKEPYERRHAADKRILVYLPDDKKSILIISGWNCDNPELPPEDFFTRVEEDENHDTVNRAISEIQGEAATLAYHIENRRLVIDDLLVSEPYRGKGIASWLFIGLVRKLLADKAIDTIRLNYQSRGAQEFVAYMATRTSLDRLITGPLNDEMGEYYLPGVFFAAPAPEIDIQPRALIDISRRLVMTLDPDLTPRQSQGLLMEAIDEISRAAECGKLNIYIPVMNDAGHPVVSGSGENLWRIRYLREMRGSRLAGEEGCPLPGAKRILEMVVEGDMPESALRIDGVSEYDNGIWVIHDRKKLHEELSKADDEMIQKLIREDETLLASDLEAYADAGGLDSNGGNSICYAYASDTKKRPIFLFAIVGPLTTTKLAVIKSGFLQARVAGERIRHIQAMAARRREIDSINKEMIALSDARYKINSFFHTLSGSTRSVAHVLGRSGTDEGARANVLQDHIMYLYGRLSESMGQIIKQFEDGRGEIETMEAFKTETDMPPPDGMGLYTRSLLNIFHAMLTADNIESMRSMVGRYQRSEGWKFDLMIDRGDISRALDIAVKYHKRLSAMTRMDELLATDRQSLDTGYWEFKIDFWILIITLDEFRNVIIAWKESNPGAFELLETAAPDTRKDLKTFNGWAYNHFDDSEARGLEAAYLITSNLIFIEDMVSIAPRILNLELKMEDTDLIRLVKDSVRLGIESAKSENIRVVPVDAQYPDGAHTVRTDSDILKISVLSELIKNAMKYNRPDGETVKVVVSVNDRAGFARISVIDSGMGISEEDRRDNLFRRSVRLERAKDIQGTGLGLYLAKHAAAWLGGQLILEESTLGAGSIFTIYLPIGGRDSVWDEVPEWADYAKHKIDSELIHASGNLSEAILEQKKLLELFYKAGHKQFPRETEIDRVKDNADIAHHIGMRLYEDLESRNLSSAYLVDALTRRVKPLVEVERIRDLLGSLKEYYRGEGAPGERIGGIDKILSPEDSNKDYLDIIAGLIPGGIINAARLSSSGAIGQILKNLDDMLQLDMREHPIPEGSRILLAEELFDCDDLPALKSVLGEDGRIQVLPARSIGDIADNIHTTKDRIACVVPREAFQRLWSGAYGNNNKATLLVLDEDLKGPNYLHLEGIIALARSMMAKDAVRIKAYSKLLFDTGISDAALKLLLDSNMVEFYKKMFFKFKPIAPVDRDELDRGKKIMEGYLTQA